MDYVQVSARDPCQNLPPPTRFDCFRKKPHFIPNVRIPNAGATGNFGRGLCLRIRLGQPTPPVAFGSFNTVVRAPAQK
jgi:hypothetical protein